jgi:hypothetical protein
MRRTSPGIASFPFLNHRTLYPLNSYGRSKETYLKAEKARAQHAQEGARDRDPEMSALPGDETAAPCLR